jgi:hypothetical protein
MEDNKNTNRQADDDRSVFVPAEEIRDIESILNKMETARRELHKVAEVITPAVTWERRDDRE